MSTFPSFETVELGAAEVPADASSRFEQVRDSLPTVSSTGWSAASP